MSEVKILFPYSKFREGQDLFIGEVINAIERKGNLMVHAPTGIGKTVSVLAPSLKFILENDLTLFFLTSRHTQHKIVVQTLKEIKDVHKENFMQFL